MVVLLTQSEIFSIHTLAAWWCRFIYWGYYPGNRESFKLVSNEIRVMEVEQSLAGWRRSWRHLIWVLCKTRAQTHKLLAVVVIINFVFSWLLCSGIKSGLEDDQEATSWIYWHCNGSCWNICWRWRPYKVQISKDRKGTPSGRLAGASIEDAN